MLLEDQKQERRRRPGPSRSRKSLRWLGLAALIVAIVVAATGILRRKEQEAQVTQWTMAEAIPTVSVITPQRGVSDVQLVLPGNIQAWYEASVYARVNGYVKDWYFDYGALVKKGQILAEIDAPDLDAELSSAQAKLKMAAAAVEVREAEAEFAETTYERWRSSPTGVVSEQERDAKKADHHSAIARLNAARAEVIVDQGEVDRLAALESFKRIIAPFDGIVIARETDIGALINAGSGVGGGNGPELFRVADVHEMRVYVQVPQQMSAGIHEGMTVELHLPQYPDRTFKASVATTSRAISMTSRTLLAELHADNPDDVLQPGSYAEAHFNLPSNPNMVHIPTSALLFRQHGLEVAVVGSDSNVDLKPVTLGRDLGTEVEVLTGLTASDSVVNSPPDSLAAGDLVHIAEESVPSGKQQQAADADKDSH